MSAEAPAPAAPVAKYDYRRIVVGTDGSPLAGPTVARAAWLAAHDDADLIVVCAFSAMTRRTEARNVATLGGDSRTGMVLGRAAANGAMAAALDVAHAQGATVTAALMMEGEPAEALLQTQADRHAGLIVVGARRDVSLADRLLGTVATEVVRRAACDVLIVRPREGDDPASEAPEAPAAG